MISKLFLVVLLIVVLFSVSASAVSMESNGQVHSITQGNLKFVTDPSGLMKLFKNGDYLGNFGFTLKGTVNGQTRFLNSWSTEWTWEVLSNTDSNITVLASTNWQGLEWKQRWFFSDTEQKFSNHLTNNTGFDVTNTRFYYVIRLDPTNVSCLNYVDNQRRANRYCFEQDITITQNLERYLKRISFKETLFNFQDLIGSGFEFKYLFLGQLNNVHPSLAGRGFIIGVTKNAGLFPDGASIELDPSVIDSSDLSKTNYGNVIVRDSSQTIFVVHEETVSSSNTDIFISKSTDDGVTFTTFNLTNSSDVNENLPHIDINSTDGLIISFDGNNSNGVFVTTCSAGGCDSNAEFLDKLDVSACGEVQCSNSNIVVDVNDFSHLTYARGQSTLEYRRNTGFVGSGWGAEETVLNAGGSAILARDGTGVIVAKNGSNRKLAYTNANDSQANIGYFDGSDWIVDPDTGAGEGGLQTPGSNVEEPLTAFAGYDGNFYVAYSQFAAGTSGGKSIHYRQCVQDANCADPGVFSADLNITGPALDRAFLSMFQATDLNLHVVASPVVESIDVNIFHFVRLPNNIWTTSSTADNNVLVSDANRTYNPLIRNRDYRGSFNDGVVFPPGNLNFDYIFLTSDNSDGDPSTLIFDSNDFGDINGIVANFTTTPGSPFILDPENGVTNVNVDFNNITEEFGIVDSNFSWLVDGIEESTDQNFNRDFNGTDADFNISLIVNGNDLTTHFTSQKDQNVLLRSAPQGIDFNFTNNTYVNNVDVNFEVTATGTINFAIWGGTDFDTNLSGTIINKVFTQNKISQVCVIVNGAGDVNKLVCKDYIVARWLVSPAIDEETSVSLTPTITNYNRPSQAYTHSADINVFTFYGPEIDFDTNAAFVIDFNTSYFTRNYFFDLDKNITFFALQPRLPVVANSIQSTIFTIDNFTRDTVPGIVIQAIRTLGGVETIIESTISDSTGTATMSFVANLDYTLRFLDADGTILSEGLLGPKSTTLFAFIGTGKIVFTLTPVGELVVTWIPHASSIDANTNFTVRFNQIINQVDLNITRLTVRISQGDTNFFAQDFNFLGTDTNIFQDVNVLDANEFGFMIVTITAQTTDGNVSKSFSYILVFKPGGSLIKNIRAMKTELGPTVALIIAIIITVSAVGGFARVATTDFNWLGIIALFILGIFTYLEWIPLTIYLVAILMGAGGLIYRWVR